MKVETSFTACFLDEAIAADIEVRHYDDDSFMLEQGEAIVLIPKSEAIAFADALKTWATQQEAN